MDPPGHAPFMPIRAAASVNDINAAVQNELIEEICLWKNMAVRCYTEKAVVIEEKAAVIEDNAALQVSLDKERERVRRRDSAVLDAQLEIYELRNQLDEKDVRIIEQTERVGRRDATIASIDEENMELRNEIAKLQWAGYQLQEDAADLYYHARRYMPEDLLYKPMRFEEKCAQYGMDMNAALPPPPAPPVLPAPVEIAPLVPMDIDEQPPSRLAEVDLTELKAAPIRALIAAVPPLVQEHSSDIKVEAEQEFQEEQEPPVEQERAVWPVNTVGPSGIRSGRVEKKGWKI